MDVDTDGGGATDSQELGWGTNPLDPIDDPFDNDNDGLTNIAENLVYQTAADNPDTDGGCAEDGYEVKNLSDPLDPADDGNCVGGAAPQTIGSDYAGFSSSANLKEGEPGLYIVPAECDTCPCISTFDHKADIVPTDIFFSVISNFNESYFFSKSNEVTIESVPTQ